MFYASATILLVKLEKKKRGERQKMKEMKEEDRAVTATSAIFTRARA